MRTDETVPAVLKSVWASFEGCAQKLLELAQALIERVSLAAHKLFGKSSEKRGITLTEATTIVSDLISGLVVLEGGGHAAKPTLEATAATVPSSLDAQGGAPSALEIAPTCQPIFFSPTQTSQPNEPCATANGATSSTHRNDASATAKAPAPEQPAPQTPPDASKSKGKRAHWRGEWITPLCRTESAQTSSSRASMPSNVQAATRRVVALCRQSSESS